MSNNIYYYLIAILAILTIFIIPKFMDKSNEKEDNLTSQAVSAVNNSYNGAILKTNFGDIEIDFMQDDAPLTVNNFIKLAEDSFYSGTKFHRVIKNFMIQGGDPLSKDDNMKGRWGTGGPGYTFEDEIHSNNQNNTGTISMANAGPNTNGSQFFINTNNNVFLNDKHTVFGKVTRGMDVVAKINQVETGEADRPVESVVIDDVVLK